MSATVCSLIGHGLPLETIAVYPANPSKICRPKENLAVSVAERPQDVDVVLVVSPRDAEACRADWHVVDAHLGALASSGDPAEWQRNVRAESSALPKTHPQHVVPSPHPVNPVHPVSSFSAAGREDGMNGINRMVE
jgi:hypothetical protein